MAAPRRFRLALLESAPRPLAPRVARELVGIGALALGGAALAAGAAWRAQLVPMPTGELEIARFLAPITQRTAPPPREERLSFIGLGAAPASVAPTATGSGDTRRATAMESSEARGETTLVQDASDAPPLQAYTEVEVDSVAIPDPNGEAPVYPPTLLKLGIEGVVLASFIVDSTGRADPNTFHLLQDADPEFVDAVRTALAKMRYRPAMFGGRRVNQLAEQRFSFRLTPKKPPVG